MSYEEDGQPIKLKPAADMPLMFAPDQILVRGITVGRGSGWVYCYYFPFVRKACSHDFIAKLNGGPFWPCKIGKTDGDYKVRIHKQFNDAVTPLFEIPVIGFLAGADDPIGLEKQIHYWFDKRFAPKDSDGKPIKNKNPRRLGWSTSGVGDEWFLTNLREVRRAYREAKWERWYFWPWRILQSWKMAFQALQTDAWG